MSFSIAGKTAIITGAANGIGLAIARHFAQEGANVMCADMDEDHLKAEYGDAAMQEDSNIAFYAGDLRKKLTIANLLSATIDAFDGVDILINASRQIMPSDPLEASNDNVERLLEQNLMTSLRLSQQIAKWMIKNAEKLERTDANVGSIVNLSSISATQTHPDLLAFSISSAAVEQMTKSLAVALAPNGIRVNAIAFGSVLSASLQSSLDQNPEYRSEIIAKTPLNSIASATQVAQSAQYLASACSEFVTGQIIKVDGGRSLLDPADIAAH